MTTPDQITIDVRPCISCGQGYANGYFYSSTLDLCRTCAAAVEQAITKCKDHEKRHSWLYQWNPKRNAWTRSRRHGSPLRDVVEAAAIAVLQEHYR